MYWGAGGRGGVAGARECEHFVSNKICNLTSLERYEEYPRLFRMYLVPLPPPPLGAEGVGFLLCPPYHVRVIANEPVACC